MEFQLPSKLKSTSYALIGIGLLAVIFGFITDSHRTWANLLVSNFFFLAIAICGTFFVALQYVSQAGWAVGLKRVPEAISAFFPIAAILLIIIVSVGGHSIYHWMHHDLYDPASAHYDKIIADKQAYLNLPFFLVRALVFLGVWALCSHLIRRNSLKEDLTYKGNVEFYKKNITISAIFIVFFAFSSSSAAWDWIMSIDTHWFSTLFGWYVFSGLFVSGLVTITLMIIYLKNQGYLNNINENHLHDLGKFIFAFSIFWTYLWVSQFLLIWYSDIPEEVTYYVARFKDFKILFLSTFVINFIFPVLVLMTRDAKRKMKILTWTGILLIAGHWLDVYVMVMPGTVGSHAYIGIIEIGIFLGFLGSFLLVVFNALGKAPLVPKNDPFILESKLHHI